MTKSRKTMTKQQILWRKSKVLDLLSDGYSEREIVNKLGLSQSTINRDIRAIRAESKAGFRDYITEQVPLEYKKTLAGLEGIIKYMSNIISDESKDARERMQATTIKLQAYDMKMELVSGAGLIPEAIDLVDRYRVILLKKPKY